MNVKHALKVEVGVVLLFCLAILSFGCGKNADTVFEKAGANSTSIAFENTVSQTPEFNIINYLYFYDGGGVSIGDINNDGLPDIYFTANMGSNRLYLNRGNFEFEDITAKAGVGGTGDWTTGTSMADVNGDGLLDIYVCNVDYRSKKGRNQLFINNGDSTFTERATEYGLDFSGYSKQAAFFDMERDGDLDMYLLNHAIHSRDSFKPSSHRKKTSEKAGDRLYRNDGGTFKNISEEAGIYSSILGYGLGVTAADLNGDHFTDIYVSNDFHENDYLYINQKDGSFREVLEQSMQHTSRASMGNDIADVNNDLNADIAVVDMLPQTERGLKTSVSAEPYKVYSIQRDYGYHPQLIRNTLQLNMGQKTPSVPLFADIAPMAGVEATDWSWSPLLFDMDNDGWKDLFVSNGIYRRPNDMDYLSKVKSEKIQNSLDRGITEENLKVVESMPHLKIPNAAYHNTGNLGFTDKSAEWGFGESSYSSGTAYGDLDNDGDLDLVINNVNSKASVYRNRTTQQDSSSYLVLRLKGRKKNSYAIGSKVIAYSGDRSQSFQLTSSRGFQSSVDPRIFLGFGDAEKVDSLLIKWPDGGETVKRNVSVNRHLTINQPKTDGIIKNKKRENRSLPFGAVKSPLSPAWKHRENKFNSFDKQPFMPYQVSQSGPCLSVGDVNSDGLEDVYSCGARKQAGTLYLQQKNGEFKKRQQEVFSRDSLFEDTDAVFFDADNNGSVDLYVVSGGGESERNAFNDRLYLNNGAGVFARADNALPNIQANGSVAVPLDYDLDGDQDLFVGSRSVAGNYGQTPESHLLENRGDGTFSKASSETAGKLSEIGMVTDAESADINGDGTPDLIIAGEWMPVTVFLNRKGDLQKSESLSAPAGLWQSIHITDSDNDGDPDILAGNMGLNTTLQASADQPLVMYMDDFNGDGRYDPIIGQSKRGKVYPIVPRDLMLKFFYYLRSKYPTYRSYAGKSIKEIFGTDRLRGAERKEVKELAHLHIENRGGGEFDVKPLPAEAQFAPVFDFFSGDFNNDGYQDVIMGGNLYDVQPVYGGPYDASFGWYLPGGKGGLLNRSASNMKSLHIQGEIRALAGVNGPGKNELIIIGINDEAPVFLK